MLKKDVIAHFGSGRAVAQALGISEEAVYQWGERVPARRAYEIERITGGAMKAEYPKEQQK